MPRKAPVVLAPVLDPDPAVGRAWGSLGEPAPDRVERIREASRSKPALYRLIFDAPARPAVYAKRSRTSDLALERAVYQEILPRLPLGAPRCFGSCRGDDGSTWLFVEDVGDRRISEESPGHRGLAARWLATLHRSAAEEPHAARLPEAGAPRYLAALHAGRAGIVRNLGNRALTAADHAVLAALLGQLDVLESHWPRIERACLGFPATLVHGDLRSKNVRVRGQGADETLCALDWEMAGWGIPAADLDSALGSGMTLPIDPGAYRDALRGTWDLDDAGLERLSVLGRIFQAVAGAKWASASLIFECERCLLRPVSQMRLYRTQIVQALEAGAGWLE